MFQGEWYILLDCSRQIGTMLIAAAGNPYSSFHLIRNVQRLMFQGEGYILLDCSKQIGIIHIAAAGKSYSKCTA
jgi:hypothetical protein